MQVDKNKIITKLFEKLLMFKLGSVPIVTMANKNIILINNEITLDDLNLFMKNNGSVVQYDSFVDFIIEFYAIKASEILKEVGESPEASIPTISFTQNGNNIIVNF